MADNFGIYLMNNNNKINVSFAFKMVMFKLFYSLLFLFSLNGQANTESIVSVKEEPVTTLPKGVEISQVWAIHESLIAVNQKHLWVYESAEHKWTAQSLPAHRSIKGVAQNADVSYLLMADKHSGFVNSVTEVSFPFKVTTNKSVKLPSALRSAAGAILNNELLIAGVSIEGESRLYGLDISTDEARWRTYPAWESELGDVSSAVTQTERLQITLHDAPHNKTQLLQWTLEDGWHQRESVLGSVIPGSAQATGQGHILYLLNEVQSQSMKMVSFHTITGAWAELKHWSNRTTLAGTGWQKGILWLMPQTDNTGTQLVSAQLQPRQHFLTLIDWVVLVVYLIAMLGIGLYFYLQHAQSSESNFFLGGRSIPFWAAGISLYASNASSISYIAVPAKAFATNWQYLMSNLIVVFGLIFVAIWIAPLLRRLNLISVFHYLETRFHPSIRLLSSILFVVFQLGGRMTVILYLPSLALSTVTGVDIMLCILVMGIVTICYTVLGGMKAVIWTDVLQLFVMFGGTIFAIVFILMKLDGGTAEFISSAVADDKFKLVDLSFNLTDATVWGFLFLVFFDTVLTFPKDQVLMQRIFSTSSAKQAGRSMWTFSAIVIPGSAMFFLIGTALYVFYQVHPERMDPSLTLDATFPLFISSELPVGVTGLIIAGIFAAAMSTLSSILNSVATVSTVDFYDKWFKKENEKSTVRFAEIITVVAGIIGIGLSLLLASFNINSLLDVALELWGLLGGGFAGAYTLGMFTKRANWQGVVVGVTVSFIVTFFAWSVDFVHPYFYMPLSVFICIVVGYAASWFFPAPQQLVGLTIYQDNADLPVAVSEK